MTRTYLDNAATSWPKPESVYAIVDRSCRVVGAPAGRSNYREAAEAERLVLDARRRVANLLGASDPSRVIFTSNGTDSLNLALHGLLREGDHVVTTVAEHNSVLRPLRYLEEHRGITVTRVGCSAAGIVDVDEVRRAITPRTRLVALIHASNVTGGLQPAVEVGRIAREHGVRFLLDAAQSLGHLPLDVRQLHVDLLAAPGHKGLLGPLGTGVLYVGPGLEHELLPSRQGGTGTRSELDTQPESLPDRYESGNHNVPGIAGVGAGAAYLAERGVLAIRSHELQLTRRLIERLSTLERLTVYGPREADQRVGVVSISVQDYDPAEVASLLDSSYGIQVRSGLHCAPLMHEALGTRKAGGTVRFSLGPFNTETQIDATVRAMEELMSAL